MSPYRSHCTQVQEFLQSMKLQIEPWGVKRVMQSFSFTKSCQTALQSSVSINTPPVVYEGFLSPYAFKHIVFSIFSFYQTGSKTVTCLNLQKSNY